MTVAAKSPTPTSRVDNDPPVPESSHRSWVGRLYRRLRDLPGTYYHHVVLHLACLAVLLVGVSLVDVLLCVGLYFVRMFAITGGYHRYFAHRSYKTSRAFQFLLGGVGCTAMQGGPLWWVATHRHHHCESDTPQDIHSPLRRGFWWSHIGWVLAGEPAETDWDRVRDLSGYPELHWLERFKVIPNLLLGAFCLVVGGWSGVVWGIIVSTVLLYHGTFAINSVGHLFGGRRYATGDGSRNNWLLALVTLGEGWHNNHHHYQGSAKMGFFWWEIDITYYLIRVLALLGLVWDVRRPPARTLTEGLAR
jgi:stearoyl-CoA desaturase (delta-9 desaturase)